jgi:GntP family gluconate:H+ symporter
MFGADLGLTIFWGTVISFISLILTWALTRSWVAKEWVEPRPEYVEGVEPTESADYTELLIKENNLPSVGSAALPILLPVFLIAVNSFVGIFIKDENNWLRILFSTLGERNIALFIGVICAFVNGYRYQGAVLGAHPNGELKDIMFGGWVARALNVALLPLMITAMGGGFSAVIKAYPDIGKLGAMIADYNFPSLLVPFVIAAIMMLAVGSRTTAGMTAAGIVLPMADQLGLSPLVSTLLCGAGTMVGSHVSDSGFWVTTQLFNLNTKQGLKYITFLGSVSGVFCLICIWVLCGVGIIG